MKHLLGSDKMFHWASGVSRVAPPFCLVDRFGDDSVMGLGGKGLGMMIHDLEPVEHLKDSYALASVYR